jgi:hypothetical protein
MLARGQVREEALPGGATGYRIADDRTAPSASGREAETGGKAPARPRAHAARNRTGARIQASQLAGGPHGADAGSPGAWLPPPVEVKGSAGFTDT